MCFSDLQAAGGAQGGWFKEAETAPPGPHLPSPGRALAPGHMAARLRGHCKGLAEPGWAQNQPGAGGGGIMAPKATHILIPEPGSVP